MNCLTKLSQKIRVTKSYIRAFLATMISKRDSSDLRSLHTFVNNCDRRVVAVRIWSGPLSIQDIETPSPENKPFRLINLPFYFAGQLDKVVAKYG